MNTTRFWEELFANIWPSFDHILYDGWLLRFADGFSTNNNSVWPLYTGNLPIDEKIVFCEEQYRERGLTCAFRLAEIPGHDTIASRLTTQGYVEENPNWVMVNPSTVASPMADITTLALDEWLEIAYQINSVDDPTLKEKVCKVLSRGANPRCFAIVARDEQACAYGYATRQGNILHLRELWVLPELRGQGIGTQLIHGLIRRGREDGADIACLAVNESNTGARRLYARLGFVQRHRYSYWELEG